MSDFNRQLGQKIKKIREELAMSQEGLARRLNIPRTSLSQAENGKREIKNSELVELSKIFNCSTDLLLDLEKGPEIILADSKAGDSGAKGLRIDVPQKNLEKFKEVLLYILNKVGARPNIGETVLYKILYFIDFDFYEKYEEQLIGATYIKNHYGPTPVEFKTIVRQMLKDEEIKKVEEHYFKYPRTKYLPLREPSLDKLKANEIEMINDVLNRLSHMNATQISEYSHGDVPWLTAEKQAPVQYESVFYRTAPYSVRKDSDDL